MVCVCVKSRKVRSTDCLCLFIELILLIASTTGLPFKTFIMVNICEKKGKVRSRDCLCFFSRIKPNLGFLLITHIAWKLSKYGVISRPYFPVFGLNKKISSVNLFQSECSKIRTRNNYVFGHISRSVRNGKTCNPVFLRFSHFSN